MRGVLSDIRGELAELHSVERLKHRARRTEWQQLGHAFLQRHRIGGVVHRRAAILDSEEHPVVVQQLVHRLHRTRHLILAVFDNVTDLAAVDATLGVGILECQTDGICAVDTLHRGHARQVGDGAHQDFGIGDPLHRSGRERARGGCGERGHRQEAPQHKHCRHAEYPSLSDPRRSAAAFVFAPIVPGWAETSVSLTEN